MIGYKVNCYWYICWVFLSPAFMVVSSDLIFALCCHIYSSSLFLVFTLSSTPQSSMVMTMSIQHGGRLSASSSLSPQWSGCLVSVWHNEFCIRCLLWRVCNLLYGDHPWQLETSIESGDYRSDKTKDRGGQCWTQAEHEGRGDELGGPAPSIQPSIRIIVITVNLAKNCQPGHYTGCRS